MTQKQNTIRSDIATFAQTTYRNELAPLRIKLVDRRAHMYLLGKTGTGKSTLLETLMVDDLKKGLGFALIDPHGDLFHRLKEKIPRNRISDLIDCDIPDPKQPYGFNPLANVPADKRSLAASGLVQVFKHLWADSWGPRLEYILRNCLLSLLDYSGASLSDIQRLLTDASFRSKVILSVTNSQIRDFWRKEYNAYPDRLRAEAIRDRKSV